MPVHSKPPKRYISTAAIQEGTVVAAEHDAGTADCCVVIRPNCSLSWRGTLVVFGSISLVSLVIALGFYLQGFWMILPFAGLEFAALAAGLYVGALRGCAREVISLRGEVIAVQKGRRQPEQTLAFQRGWARIELARPLRRGYPSRLLIRCHGHAVEVGGCLNEAERNRLADHLQRWIPLAPTPLVTA
ncbi:MAG: DUF2244 domain-containing protein [Gammaproteobacteria bacterium]